MRQKLTIRKKIIISSTSILLLALIISGSFFSFSYYKIRQEAVYKEFDLAISTIEDAFSSNFSSLNNLASNFLSTHYIRSWMDDEVSFVTNSPKDYATISNMQKEIIYTLIFNDAWLKKIIDTAYLFDDEACIPLVSRVGEQQALTIEKNKKIYENIKYYRPGTYFLSPTLEDNHCYYIKKISSSNFKKELTLVISINQENFARSLYNLSEDYVVHIVDANNKIFFSKNNAMLGATLQIGSTKDNKSIPLLGAHEILVHNKPYLNINRTIDSTGFRISVSVPKCYISGELIHSLYYYFGIMFLFIIFFISIAIVVVGNYTRIIEDILIHIKEIRHRNYGTRMPYYKDHELNMISTTFNDMAEEFQELIDKVYKSELLLKELDISLLQSQMNPHFLLNTLTTISTKALLGGDTELYEMVSALSGLLSATLYNKQESFCKIYDELEYIKMYLYIQHVRFQDKLQYFITVEDDALLNYSIPRLSVEPIVENAVIHGLEDNIDNGIVSIHVGFDSHNAILFTISDNGKGFNVKEVLENSNRPGSKRPHIGIHNTKKRLQLIYGPEYGITFESEENKGTTAFIKIPKQEI